MGIKHKLILKFENSQMKDDKGNPYHNTIEWELEDAHDLFVLLSGFIWHFYRKEK